MPISKASMPTKCMDEMPLPMTVAAPAIQAQCEDQARARLVCHDTYHHHGCGRLENRILNAASEAERPSMLTAGPLSGVNTCLRNAARCRS